LCSGRICDNKVQYFRCDRHLGPEVFGQAIEKAGINNGTAVEDQRNADRAILADEIEDVSLPKILLAISSAPWLL
jgi:hypothetical protein